MGSHQCEQISSRWSWCKGFSGLGRLVMFQPAHVPGGITTTSLAFGLIAPDDAPIIATSSLHPLSPCWTPALLSLFNLCGHLLVFRHPFSLDDRPDLASKWPSTSESNMYGFCFHKPRAHVYYNVSSRALVYKYDLTMAHIC